MACWSRALAPAPASSPGALGETSGAAKTWLAGHRSRGSSGRPSIAIARPVGRENLLESDATAESAGGVTSSQEDSHVKRPFGVEGEVPHGHSAERGLLTAATGWSGERIIFAYRGVLMLLGTITRSRDPNENPFAVNRNMDFPQEERLAVCLEEGAKIISFFW
jgi:hypothetical protein